MSKLSNSSTLPSTLRFGFKAWDSQDSTELQAALENREVVFHDVDTQVDFIHRNANPRLSLAVRGAPERIPVLKALVDFLRSLVTPVNPFQFGHVKTRDAHTADDPEFSLFTAFSDQHCVEGTPGAESIPETVLSDDVRTVSKDPNLQDAPDQAEFEALVQRGATVEILKNTNGFTERLIVTGQNADGTPKIEYVPQQKILNFLDAMKAAGKKVAIVFGFATDYCVKKAVQGYQASGFKVIVVEDAVKGAMDNAENDPFYDTVPALTFEQLKAEILKAKSALI